MGGLRYDARELPLPLREQVAQKIVAQIMESHPVAGRAETVTKVPVRKLSFRDGRAAERYRVLRDAVREGAISGLQIEHEGRFVNGFTYRVTWSGEFVPTGVPVTTLREWRELVLVHGQGCLVTEVVETR